MQKSDIPDYSEEAEHGILGSMLIDPTCIPLIARRIRAEDFRHPIHAELFGILLAKFQDGHPLDTILLTQHLRGNQRLDDAGGAAFITHLFTSTPTAANAGYYAEIIREHADVFRIWKVCRAVVERALCPDAVTDISGMAAKLAGLLSDLTTSRPVESLTMAQHVDLALERYEHATTHRNELPAGALATGIAELDKWVVFCPGDLVILAAEPSGGKTALALQFVEEVAVKQKAEALVVSYEMTAAQLTDRLIAHQGGVAAFKLRSGIISEMEFMQLGARISALRESGIHLRDSVGHWTVDDIAAEARAVKARFGLGLIVVDYLQIAAPRRGFNNREREVADISRNLKSLAIEMGVPVIALSQLNEDGKLRESRAISHDANTILVIKDDPDGREDWRQITVAKNRDGVRDKDVPVFWNGPLMKFS